MTRDLNKLFSQVQGGAGRRCKRTEWVGGGTKSLYDGLLALRWTDDDRAGGAMGLLRGYGLVSRRLTCSREQSISHKVYRPYDQLLFRSSFLLLPSMAGSTELQVLRERTAGCVRAWVFRGEEQTKAGQMQRRSVRSGRRGGKRGTEGLRDGRRCSVVGQ